MHPIQLSLRKLSRPDKVKIYMNFFKTGKGEYGEGDKFIGVTMPDNRTVAKEFINTSLKDLEIILKSEVHEDRMCVLIILTYKYEIAKSDNEKDEIFYFYLNNISSINNWDLVDVSAPRILGAYLSNKDKSILYKLVQSPELWERRISIISTFHFIKNNKFDDTLKISEILMSDRHDLIHKACGWMLREVGKRDINVLEKFLKKHYKSMPRTMLRYAIERFPENKRKAYLKGKI